MTKEEVQVAVMSIKSFKAPGSNGFQPFFFKHYWEVVGDNVWRLVKDAFVGAALDPHLVETLIVLILKIDQPMHLKDFHPISLCNVYIKSSLSS